MEIKLQIKGTNFGIPASSCIEVLLEVSRTTSKLLFWNLFFTKINLSEIGNSSCLIIIRPSWNAIAKPKISIKFRQRDDGPRLNPALILLKIQFFFIRSLLVGFSTLLRTFYELFFFISDRARPRARALYSRGMPRGPATTNTLTMHQKGTFSNEKITYQFVSYRHTADTVDW